MKKWMGCCFPSNKDDVQIKDKSLEYNDEQRNPEINDIPPLVKASDSPSNNHHAQHSQRNTTNNNNTTSNNTNTNNNIPPSHSANPNNINNNSSLHSAKDSTINNNVNNVNTNNNTNNAVKPPSIKKDDVINSFINSKRQITQSQIDEAPTLILQEEPSGTLFNKKEIKINAGGLIGGRGLNDGVAIFGQYTPIEESKTTFKADFNVVYNEKLPYPYLFAIYYQLEQKKYYIQAYKGQGTDIKILFVKLTNGYTLPLKQKEILSAGNIIFQVAPIDNHCLEISNLSMKDNKPIKQVFDPIKDKEVTLGRDKKCNFSYPDNKSFSKIHTTFVYDDNKMEWLIQDGNKIKSSTNGTWVFGMHSFEIKDQMTVEILTSKVKILMESK